MNASSLIETQAKRGIDYPGDSKERYDKIRAHFIASLHQHYLELPETQRAEFANWLQGTLDRSIAEFIKLVRQVGFDRALEAADARVRACDDEE
ncbi:MAG: hypothetical protein B7Z02_07760 [Rhodobacterales bacterium 32-67-9]|nr:MAG: hypothetical protein B7Z02_07760 [Rhodobacterales bacterium 32-67-9]